MTSQIFLLLLLFASVYGGKEWRENQPGTHERSSLEWIVKENERIHSDQITPECSKKIGYHLWESLKASKESLCESIHRYHHSYSHLLLMENVSLTSTQTKSVEWDTPYMDSELRVLGDCSSFLFMRHFRPLFSEFEHTPQRDLNRVCKQWNDSPLFVLPWFDSANWWHFIEHALFQTFLHFGVVQSELLQDSRNVHIAILRWPSDRRPNTREQGVYPTWVALPEILERMFGSLRIVPLSPFNGECFRRVAWVSNAETYLDIKRLNTLLGQRTCFSSVLRSASDVMRSVMGVPHLINPTGNAKKEIRVAYMKRDRSATWTTHQAARSISNQDQLVEFLRGKCATAGYSFEALEFYYRDMKNAKEQVTAVGAVNVMIGVHGAGLGTMMALPPQSLVFELQMNAADNHFNHLAHLLGHSYVSYNMGRGMNMEEIWNALSSAIGRHEK